jgi:hypothetical protein
VHYRAVRIIFIGSEVLAGVLGLFQSRIGVAALMEDVADSKPIDRFVTTENIVVAVLLCVSIVSVMFTVRTLWTFFKKSKVDVLS